MVVAVVAVVAVGPTRHGYLNNQTRLGRVWTTFQDYLFSAVAVATVIFTAIGDHQP